MTKTCLRRALNAIVVSLAIAALCAVSAAPTHATAPDGTDNRIAAHVAAGEFAPAIRLAEESADTVERDRRLARVVHAQRAAGAVAAAATTTGRIDDETLRADVYGNIASLSTDKSAGGQQGGFGGGNEPDFDSILDLVKSTVAPQSWDDVGGAGSAKGFANGIYVDPEGVLHRLAKSEAGASLLALRDAGAPSDLPLGDVCRESRLRKVSLSRLERALAERAAAGRSADEAMQYLAGMREIKYVLVYPETGDLVLAGPAGDWRRDAEDRIVGGESGRPVIRLDDLVVILRHVMQNDQAAFGCTINPTQKGLAATRRYVDETSKKPLAAGDRAREKWIAGLRSSLGRQDIEVFGIDPGSRVARVLVEADYRMKLVGLGLEEGVLGVPSYLEGVKLGKDGRVPPMDVLRWWFTLDYDALRATPDRLAFELVGQGTKVLSENQFLEVSGKRQSTGKSTPANSEFAHNFTKHFAALAEKYPVYAELKNLCDVALAAAVIKSERLHDRARWSMAWLGDAEKYQVATAESPQSVETIVAHRLIGGKHVVAAISGGVRIDPTRFAAGENIKAEKYTALAAEKKSAAPPVERREVWWWD